MRLCECAGSSKPSLVACAITIKYSMNCFIYILLQSNEYANDETILDDNKDKLFVWFWIISSCSLLENRNVMKLLLCSKCLLYLA